MRMETRTIKELLQVLLDNEDYFTSGLCALKARLVTRGIINHDEEIDIRIFLNKNLPKKKYSQWKNGPLLFSFQSGEWPPRKEWLEQEINKL